jgi:hypothetical protein
VKKGENLKKGRKRKDEWNIEVYIVKYTQKGKK